MIKFLDLQAQYESIRPEIDGAVQAVLAEQAFIGGRFVKKFEEEFADYLGVEHCVGVGNGTDALEIALEALDLPAGSEVIVPANSFIATSEAVSRVGHAPVFCDCDPETYTLSIEDLRSRITTRTAAIIPVHLYGHPCDMGAVLALAGEHGLRVVEDCAQAHGAEYRGQKVGTFGDAAAFSFYPGKNLGAYGDAGAITCRDDALARRCRMIANHGRVDKYDHVFEGRNSRLDSLQAAILSVKLPFLEQWTEARRTVAAEYKRLLAGVLDLVLPSERSDVRHVYHLFVVRSEERDSLREHLRRGGVQTGVHYPVALPRLRAYAGHESRTKGFFANRVGGTLLSLPIGEHLSGEEIRRVASAIESYQRRLPGTVPSR